MSSLVLDELPYSIDNLPYGVISTSNEPQARCAVAIGQHAIDLAKYANARLLEIDGKLGDIFSQVCHKL
jgi:fumarylacetoacetase